MLLDTINGLIVETTKSQDKVRLNAIKTIKTELMKDKTSGNPYTEDVELKTMSRLVKQYKEAISEFEKNGGETAAELIKQYSGELNVIQEFAPKDATEDEIRAKIDELINTLKTEGKEISMKDMKFIQDSVKNVYPTADGKIISSIFRTKL